MTIPEKTGIYSVRDALGEMAKQIQDPRFFRLVRDSSRDGNTFEAVLTIKCDHNGYLVSMNGYSRKKVKAFGTLLRLPHIAPEGDAE